MNLAVAIRDPRPGDLERVHAAIPGIPLIAIGSRPPDTPLDVAESRDPKGLYAKARAGELANFTGIDSPYEAPEAPEIRVDTTTVTAEEAADRIVEVLRARGTIA